MLGAAFSESVSIAVVNASLFALTLVLPALLARQMRNASRRLSPDFSLRRLESLELDRAELLYRRISQRLGEIERLAAGGAGAFWKRMRHRAQVRREYRAELEDLTACASHLRASIVRLRRRPIQRLRTWVHIVSCRSAVAGSVASYLTILVPATIFIYFAEQPLWAQELTNTLGTALVWTPLDERLLYVNGITAGFALILAPFLYAVRRAKLYSDHRLQRKSLADFAAADPDQLTYEDSPETACVADPATIELESGDAWFAVLGLSPMASVDEVREAYKAKIKQVHPDRVHGMAPAFRTLAEAETKKLNVAYEEALDAVQAA